MKSFIPHPQGRVPARERLWSNDIRLTAQICHLRKSARSVHLALLLNLGLCLCLAVRVKPKRCKLILLEKGLFARYPRIRNVFIALIASRLRAAGEPSNLYIETLLRTQICFTGVGLIDQNLHTNDILVSPLLTYTFLIHKGLICTISIQCNSHLSLSVQCFARGII